MKFVSLKTMTPLTILVLPDSVTAPVPAVNFPSRRGKGPLDLIRFGAVQKIARFQVPFRPGRSTDLPGGPKGGPAHP